MFRVELECRMRQAYMSCLCWCRLDRTRCTRCHLRAGCGSCCGRAQCCRGGSSPSALRSSARGVKHAHQFKSCSEPERRRMCGALTFLKLKAVKCSSSNVVQIRGLLSDSSSGYYPRGKDKSCWLFLKCDDFSDLSAPLHGCVSH